ncbi:MAG: GNAT family acetyltransferase [Bifidobacterium dentium]|nr:MAG: GNAT family acetyltransferase [Bifidobacterium dentium]
MLIRHATMDDLDAIVAVEAACFPPAEAASNESLTARVAAYPDHFWLLVNTESDDDACFPASVQDGTLVGFVNGMTTDEPDLSDAMYDDASMHDENGAWQMIFGVDTAPVYQHRGCASYLLRRVILDSVLAGRNGIVLTCKERLIGFYARLGFVDEGVSSSTHGNVVWHQMRLKLTHATTEQADRAAEGPGEVTAAIAVVKAGMPSGSPTRPVEAAEPGMGDAIGAATESATLPQYAPASADTLNTSSHATLPAKIAAMATAKSIRVAMSEATATMDREVPETTEFPAVTAQS